MVESSPVAKLERSPIYRMPEIFRLLPKLEERKDNDTKTESQQLEVWDGITYILSSMS